MSKIKLANITIDTDTITAKERAELHAATAEPVQPKGGLNIFTEKPRVRERYYVIGYDGIIYDYIWCNDDSNDQAWWNHRTLHRTRASAELEKAHRIAEVELTKRCVALGGRIGNKFADGKEWFGVTLKSNNVIGCYSAFQTVTYAFLFPTRELGDAFISSPNFEQLFREFYYMEAK